MLGTQRFQRVGVRWVGREMSLVGSGAHRTPTPRESKTVKGLGMKVRGGGLRVRVEHLGLGCGMWGQGLGSKI